MNFKRWLFTILSFAGVLGVTAYFTLSWWHAGGVINLPMRAHLLAIAAVATEIATRALKVTWSAKAVRIELPILTAVRTTLAGDFGASITPARSGAEPARFFVLAESGVPAPGALLILYAELFLEALSLATVVIIVAVIFPHAGVVLGALLGVVGVYAAFVIGIGILVVVLARRNIEPHAPKWLQRLGVRGRRWEVVKRWIEHVRTTVATVKTVNKKWMVGSYLASLVHVAMRLCVLPALVLGAGVAAPVAPLALWPLGLLYGAAVVPAPGGGGAVELAFRAALFGVIGKTIFPAALLWWRFYTFYLYIILGAIVAGNVALRAVHRTHEAY